MNRILKVHPDDNVLVALSNLSAGESIKYNGSEIKLADNIPAKHKFVLNDLHSGDSIIMYGVLVGKAQSDIPKGGLISTANVKHAVEDIRNRRIFKNVDGIKFLNHQGGCGGIRQDSAILSKLLAAYADHPNVGGVTVMSLGCQNLQVSNFLQDLKQRNPHFTKPLYIFEQQQSTSEEQLITDAIRKTF